MLLSVHVPKAGGTSTLALLRELFPGSKLLLDYDDNPGTPLALRQLDPARYLARRVQPPRWVEAVHGHVHPAKYLDVPDARWFTILRRPPELMISIYWFWKSETFDDPLHRYFAEQRLGVEDLARLPIMRTLLSETYFGGIDMTRFDVIGAHEDRGTALRRLGELLDHPLPPDQRLRETPGREQIDEMLADDALLRRLESILAEDVAFYERWAGR